MRNAKMRNYDVEEFQRPLPKPTFPTATFSTYTTPGIKALLKHQPMKEIPATKQRTDGWIAKMLKKDDDELSKKDIRKVVSYLREEIEHSRQYEDNIEICLFNLRSALHLLACGGYKKLGFKSFKACIEKKFVKASKSKLYRQAAAARIEVILFGPGQIGYVSESVLRPLNKFKKDKANIKRAWKKAMGVKSEKDEYPTAEQVTAVVNKMKKPKISEKNAKWSDKNATEISNKISSEAKKILDKYVFNKSDKRLHTILKKVEENLLDVYGLLQK